LEANRAEYVLIVEIVPRLAIDDIWDSVKDLVAKTNDAVLNELDVLELLRNGTYTLWVAIDPVSNKVIVAATVEFVYYPRDKVCRVVTVGGERLNDWIHHLTTLEEWAKKQGCTYMDMYGRRGWIKILKDYTEDCVLLRKEL